MYRENFKTELPQFSDKQVLISELGAVSRTFSDQSRDPGTFRTWRWNAGHSGWYLGICADPLTESCAASSGKPGSFKIYQEQGRLSVSHHKL